MNANPRSYVVPDWQWFGEDDVVILTDMPMVAVREYARQCKAVDLTFDEATAVAIAAHVLTCDAWEHTAIPDEEGGTGTGWLWVQDDRFAPTGRHRYAIHLDEDDQAAIDTLIEAIVDPPEEDRVDSIDDVDRADLIIIDDLDGGDTTKLAIEAMRAHPAAGVYVAQQWKDSGATRDALDRGLGGPRLVPSNGA